MNDSWWWLVIWVGAAGVVVGVPIGYWFRKKDDDLRYEEYRQAQIRIKQAQLHRNGRKLPRRRDAGAPIIVRKARFRKGAPLQ